MWTRRRFILTSSAAPLLAQTPKRTLRRAESYFGLHFDLHPNEKDTALGRDVTPEMVGALLDAVKPDFVQYDSKGHPGWLGWPSKVGPSAPGIVKDSLEVWHAETARRGVALYTHFSGVWDSQAVQRHPEWARVRPDGKPDPNETSTFGPYVDKLMIPELREAATKYSLDGVWVDGECWATNPDYCEAAVRGFGKPAPKSEKDPYWNEWLDYQREQFRRYLRHYLAEMHRSHPKLQIASNWMYSTHVPEEPTIDVDFLSGDYSGNVSIPPARLEARYISQNGKPWDLMAWGFLQASSTAVGHVHKPAAQLAQEAGVVLAQGGGFQVYYVPTRAGYFDSGMVKIMAEVAQHCRSLQSVAQATETVPQIGIVFSRHSLYTTGGRVFGGWGKAMHPAGGWLDLALGCQWSADIVPDWKLKRVVASYPFLILPEWDEPGEEVHATLLEYVKNGGRLLVAGAKNSQRWAADCGVKTLGAESDQDSFLVGEVPGHVKGIWQDLDPGTARVLAERYPEVNAHVGGMPAAVEARIGKGAVVLVPGPVGVIYAATHAGTVRRFGQKLIGAHFRPLVRVEAPPTVEVVLRRKAGKLLVHLLNTTAMQVSGEYSTVDFIPPAGPIRLTLGKQRPSEVKRIPSGQVLTPTLRNGEWGVEFGHLALHEVATVVG